MPGCCCASQGVRLRDIAAGVGITERSAFGIVTDLAEAGYVVKQKDDHRNRYQIQAHLPLPEPASQEPAIGDVLALLADAGARLQLTGTGPACGRRAPVAGRRSGSVAAEPDDHRLKAMDVPGALAGLPGPPRGGGALGC